MMLVSAKEKSSNSPEPRNPEFSLRLLYFSVELFKATGETPKGPKDLIIVYLGYGY